MFVLWERGHGGSCGREIGQLALQVCGIVVDMPTRLACRIADGVAVRGSWFRGTDERISIASLRLGMRVVWEALREMRVGEAERVI